MRQANLEAQQKTLETMAEIERITSLRAHKHENMDPKKNININEFLRGVQTERQSKEFAEVQRKQKSRNSMANQIDEVYNRKKKEKEERKDTHLN